MRKVSQHGYRSTLDTKNSRFGQEYPKTTILEPKSSILRSDAYSHQMSYQDVFDSLGALVWCRKIIKNICNVCAKPCNMVIDPR